MFGRMMALMRKDAKAGLRDSLLVYMIVAPILFSVIMLGLFPLIEGSSVGFAVAGDLEPRALEAMERHGAVEIRIGTLLV